MMPKSDGLVDVELSPGVGLSGFSPGSPLSHEIGIIDLHQDAVELAPVFSGLIFRPVLCCGRLTEVIALRFAPAASVEPSRIRAIAALAEDFPGTLRLFYGEDTLPTPDFLKAAGQRALAENHTYYTPNAGYLSLRQAIADQVEALHGVQVDPAREVVVTASGMVAILLACQATVGPGTSAIVLTPLWPNVAAAVRVTGAEAIEVPLGLVERSGSCVFELDFDRLEAAVRPDTRLLALASPGNPTAWTATEADWQRLLSFCERHHLWLLADGVYERIVFGALSVAPSPLAIPEARERTIIAQSFSKTYRMTGWRVGYTIAPPELSAAMTHLQEFVVSHAAGFAQEAARVGIQEGEPFVAESRARYARNAEIAIQRLSALEGLTVPTPSGAFYVFPRLDGLTDSVELCEHLVREHRLGLAPGSAFGPGGEGHIRLCFAVEEATLVEALNRFETAWSAWRCRS